MHFCFDIKQRRKKMKFWQSKIYEFMDEEDLEWISTDRKIVETLFCLTKLSHNYCRKKCVKLKLHLMIWTLLIKMRERKKRIFNLLNFCDWALSRVKQIADKFNLGMFPDILKWFFSLISAKSIKESLHINVTLTN